MAKVGAPKTKVLVLSAVLVTSAGIGATAATRTSDDGTTTPVDSYQRTSDGRTLGALRLDGDHLPLDEIPDLVRVVGDNGVEGYVEAKLLLGEETPPASPEEAIASQNTSTLDRLPVFAADGVTVVDSFTVGGPEPPPLPSDAPRP